MGIARIIPLLLIAIGAYLLYKRFFSKSVSTTSETSVKTDAMIQCQRCDVYVPQSQAIEANGHYFCSQTHRQEYEQES